MQTELNNSAYPILQCELPSGWRWVKLGEVCKINPSRPKNFARSLDAPTTFVPMAVVDERTGTIFKSKIVPYSKVSRGYTYFEENDVLFAKITPCMQNGKHAIAKNLIDGIGFGTTEFHVLRASTEILPEWIHNFIRQPSFLEEATAYFTGVVGQQRVPKNFLEDYLIPLPSIDEQRRIIWKVKKLMKQVEYAHFACKKQLEAARALPAAYLQEVFESEEAKKWKRMKLGEVCELCQYGLTAIATNTGRFPYIRITDIDDQGNIKDDNLKFINCELNTYQKYALKSGDIVFARSGSIGRTFLYNGFPPNAIFASYLIRFRVNKDIINPRYLFFYTHSSEYFKFIEEKKHVVSQPNINANEYKLLSIPIPVQDEQDHIIAKLKEKMIFAEKLVARVKKQIKDLKMLFQVILLKAFNGEL